MEKWNIEKSYKIAVNNFVHGIKDKCYDFIGANDFPRNSGNNNIIRNVNIPS